MTLPARNTMEAVETLIRSALFDPGKYVKRESYPYYDSSRTPEELYNWQTRAVLKVLTDNGLRVMTAQEIDAIHSDGFRQAAHD